MPLEIRQHRNGPRTVPRQRPIVAVLVAEPHPLAVAQLQRLAGWAQVVCLEGRTTHHGRPRKPLADDWRDITGLSRADLRIVVTDLQATTPRGRERQQRDVLLAAIVGEPADRLVILADDDEFLDPDVVAELAVDLPAPTRLRLRPLYGAIDQLAPASYCCANRSPETLRDPAATGRSGAWLAGPLMATVGQLLGRSPGALRKRAPKTVQKIAAGWHLTYAQAVAEVASAMAGGAHDWHERTRWPTHLATTLGSGVHHAGWWLTQRYEPEQWLDDLAVETGLRRVGTLPSLRFRSALRAWAQARLTTDFDDATVHRIDGQFAQPSAELVAEWLAHDEAQRAQVTRPTGYRA